MNSPEFNTFEENNDGYTNKRSGGKDQRPQREADKAKAGTVPGTGSTSKNPRK